MELFDSHKMFGGRQLRYRHSSSVLSCDMVFSIYLPPQAEQGSVPVLYWLSGLTCDDQNFVTKAGAQQYAAEHGIAIVVSLPSFSEDLLQAPREDRPRPRDHCKKSMNWVLKARRMLMLR